MTWTLPVPNGTTWTDEAAGDWESFGADITVHNPPDWRGVRFTIEIETDTDDVYEDVTDDYVGASWSGSSRVRFGEVFQPGGATITMRNTSDFEYLVQPPDSKVAIGRGVIITAHHGDESTPMWRGTIRSIAADLREGEPALTTIVCQTALGFAGRANRPAVTPVGSGEDVDVRIGRILDSIGWPAGLRDLDTWTPNGCLATDLAGNALDELNTAALTFSGELYEDAATGTIVFVNATNKVAKAAAAAKVALGADTYALVNAAWFWLSAVITSDLDEVVNYADMANDGGAVQTEQYAASQDDYGFAGASRTDLISNNVNEPGTVAQLIVSKRALPTEQYRQVTVADGPADFVHEILTLEVLDNVQIAPPQAPTFTGGLTQVQGISFVIAPARPTTHPQGRSDVWTVTLQLDNREHRDGVTVDA